MGTFGKILTWKKKLDIKTTIWASNQHLNNNTDAEKTMRPVLKKEQSKAKSLWLDFVKNVTPMFISHVGITPATGKKNLLTFTND